MIQGGGPFSVRRDRFESIAAKSIDLMTMCHKDNPEPYLDEIISTIESIQRDIEPVRRLALLKRWRFNERIHAFMRGDK